MCSFLLLTYRLFHFVREICGFYYPTLVVANYCLCNVNTSFHIHKPHSQENIFILGSVSI